MIWQISRICQTDARHPGNGIRICESEGVGSGGGSVQGHRHWRRTAPAMTDIQNREVDRRRLFDVNDYCGPRHLALLSNRPGRSHSLHPLAVPPSQTNSKLMRRLTKAGVTIVLRAGLFLALTVWVLTRFYCVGAAAGQVGCLITSEGIRISWHSQPLTTQVSTFSKPPDGRGPRIFDNYVKVSWIVTQKAGVLGVAAGKTTNLAKNWTRWWVAARHSSMTALLGLLNVAQWLWCRRGRTVVRSGE